VTSDVSDKSIIGARSFVTLSCPSCEREVDIYIASAPLVGAWCSCKESAMEITYERRWDGSQRDAVEA
jgi:hypothetical protein